MALTKRQPKIDPKITKAIITDLKRIEDKHGQATTRSVMRRYLENVKERKKRVERINQLKSELLELEQAVR